MRLLDKSTVASDINTGDIGKNDMAMFRETAMNISVDVDTWINHVIDHSEGDRTDPQWVYSTLLEAAIDLRQSSHGAFLTYEQARQVALRILVPGASINVTTYFGAMTRNYCTRELASRLLHVLRQEGYLDFRNMSGIVVHVKSQ